MSMPKGKKPARATSRRRSRSNLFYLTQAEGMLPLVKHIMEDVQHCWQHLLKLEKEQDDLDRRRRDLFWPERARRYQIADEIASEQGRLRDAAIELEQLNVILVDPVYGEVAFPTQVQGRKSYFVWRVGAEQVKWWCFANEPQRRVIPESWRQAKLPDAPNAVADKK
jgi:hypothetical protein